MRRNLDVTPIDGARLEADAGGANPVADGMQEGFGTAPRGLHVVTWGCQMNVYDSGRMVDVLAPLGFVEQDRPEGADLVILNTCHIRERATEKLFSELGRLRRLQQARAEAGGRMRIAVAGCVAQAEGAVIHARAPYVDIVFGPQTYHRLPAMLAAAERGARVVETEFPPEDKFDYLPDERAPRAARSLTAFLSIQEGCDKFCSFCVVPYTRGAEASRPAASVLAEARRLVAAGALELTLLGQNVNGWHGAGLDGRDWRFGTLLRALADIPGLARLRYTTSHPGDMDETLIAAHREVAAVMPTLHLPVQSGSDAVLAQMNRRHTRDAYLGIIDRLRAARPDIALSTDVIVGFPGETDRDFADTLDLIERVGFAQAYSFAYSPRPGTQAAARSDQVADAVKQQRLQQVQALLAAQQARFNAECAGRVLPVLFVGPGRRPGQISGRSPYLQPVHVAGGAGQIGRILPVRIDTARPNSLAGTLLEAATDIPGTRESESV